MAFDEIYAASMHRHRRRVRKLNPVVCHQLENLVFSSRLRE